MGQEDNALPQAKGWYAQHCVWVDPCCAVMPGAPRSALDAKQAAYGKSPRWMSADKKAWPRNLRATPHGGQLAHWGARKFPKQSEGGGGKGSRRGSKSAYNAGARPAPGGSTYPTPLIIL